MEGIMGGRSPVPVYDLAASAVVCGWKLLKQRTSPQPKPMHLGKDFTFYLALSAIQQCPYIPSSKNSFKKFPDPFIVIQITAEI